MVYVKRPMSVKQGRVLPGLPICAASTNARGEPTGGSHCRQCGGLRAFLRGEESRCPRLWVSVPGRNDIIASVANFDYL